VVARDGRERLEEEAKNAAIATRPCLISAWRRYPIVASLPIPQKSPSAIRLNGSQKPICWPRKSGFDSASSTISALPFSAIDAFGPTGAT